MFRQIINSIRGAQLGVKVRQDYNQAKRKRQAEDTKVFEIAAGRSAAYRVHLNRGKKDR